MESRFLEGRIELRLYCEVCRREVNFECPRCVGKTLGFRLPKHLFCRYCIFELELEIPPRHKADLKDALQAYNQGASDPRLRGGIFVFRDGTEVTELCSWDEQGIFVSGAGKIESRRLKELNEMSGIQ